MTDSRPIRAKKNIASSLLSQVVVLACGIIIPRLMIGAFGSEAYGATASIAQFLAYITLLEGGIGGVARAVLYKPLAQRDMESISSIMEEVKRFFRVIAWIFAGYVLVLACAFKTISQIACMDWISTAILVVVISISTFGQYFIGISNSILLQADQKSYVNNALSIGATVLNAISIVVLIKLQCNLIIVKLVSSMIFFMRPVVLSLYVRKHYSLKKYKTKSQTKHLTQKWTGLGQHIAFFLHTNTDTAVLTVLANLSSVAVYSVYNMVISSIQGLASSFSSGMEALFGDMLARDEKRELHDTFGTYETTLSVVSIVLFSVTASLIVPFIRLYTAGISDADYIQPLFALLMILTALSYCLRQPYHSMVIAAGHFKQTSGAAYGEALINIVMSVILVFNYGLIGVAAATLIATWFRFIYYVFYLSKHIMGREIKLFLKRLFINAGTFLGNCMIGYWIVSHFPLHNYLWWAICGLILVITISATTLGINVIFFRKDCRALIKRVIK